VVVSAALDRGDAGYRVESAFFSRLRAAVKHFGAEAGTVVITKWSPSTTSISRLTEAHDQITLLKPLIGESKQEVQDVERVVATGQYL
jgi:hypothetical protein